MLYDSTRVLLQSILRSLETGGEIQWDDQRESANACLYEIHQMAGRMYKPYKSDSLGNPASPSALSERLNRAVPYVRDMVVAIRLKDRVRALESGRTALGEMNGVVRPAVVVPAPEPKPAPPPLTVVPPRKKPVAKRPVAASRQRKPLDKVRAAAGK